jgi:cysteine synthase A
MRDESCPRPWIANAIAAIEADVQRSADTHLIRAELPMPGGVQLYLKDESIHPSGSLKHRLARSLFLYALCNGWMREGKPVIEASSGSTAISEAYFARLLGLPFIAVVPHGTAPRKIDAIRFYGGDVRFVECPTELDACCRALAIETGGCFLDQFTHAERATDWRGNNNIAESLFSQMAKEPQSAPDWIVVGAGTGGTSATFGRYIRLRGDLVARTKLCVVDPDGSAFFDGYAKNDPNTEGRTSGIVEGIGRPRVEKSFVPTVIDRMIRVPDAASVAATLWLERWLGRRCGPSTGTNLIGALALADELAGAGRRGAIAALICDAGERYAETIYDPAWRTAQGLDLAPWSDALAAMENSERFNAELAQAAR